MISVDPQEIERTTFKTTRLKEGYDPDQVDEFLDRVAVELRGANAALTAKDEEIVRLKRQVAEQQRMLDEYGNFDKTQVLPAVPAISAAPAEPVSATAARILESAHKTADDVISQAQAQAQDVLAKANSDAQDKAAAVLADALKRRDAIQAKCNDLDTMLTDHDNRRQQLRATMADMLARLEGTP